MEQVITGKFDALYQAEGAATKLRSIRANDVEISEWHGGSASEAAMNSGGVGQGMSMLGYNPNNSSMGGISGGAFGIGAGYSSSGLSFLPFMGNDTISENTNRTYLLNALIHDEHRDKAVTIIREAGGREF